MRAPEKRVGCGMLNNSEPSKSIQNWEFISQKILTIEMQLERKGDSTTFIIVCEPSEDKIVIKKEEFWRNYLG